MADGEKRMAINPTWMERKDWEEVQHLAETALKLLEDPSTRDLASSLIVRVEACTRHLNNLAQQAKEKQV
jgi:hypothetical protein